MASGKTSLRAMVEDWLAPGPAKSVRITEFRNRRSRRECHVRVEVLGGEGHVALFFFRHEDGSWCIFPPARERPAMRII